MSLSLYHERDKQRLESLIRCDQDSHYIHIRNRGAPKILSPKHVRIFKDERERGHIGVISNGHDCNNERQRHQCTL